MRKKGQAAVEYLIITGFALAIILPLTYLIYNYSQQSYGEVAEAQVTTIGRQIVANAETMFYLGEPSRITLDSTMPAGVFNMSIYKNDPITKCVRCNELRFIVLKGSAFQEVVISSSVNITIAPDIRASIGTTGNETVEVFNRSMYSEGLKRITIAAKEDSVEIGLR